MLVKQRCIALFFFTREQTEKTESKGSQEIKELGYDLRLVYSYIVSGYFHNLSTRFKTFILFESTGLILFYGNLSACIWVGMFVQLLVMTA